MSCSLHWRPIAAGDQIGDVALRDAIEEEFGLPCKLTTDDLPFLRGLRAAKVEGADELVAIVSGSHGTIELFKEC